MGATMRRTPERPLRMTVTRLTRIARTLTLSTTVALVTTACGILSPSPAVTNLPSASLPTPGATVSVASDTVWLCRPGLADNPCLGNLDATVVDADGSTHVESAVPAEDPPIDCFYIYPTVSHQAGTNSDLTIDPEERAVATAQAARFSQVCRVYAPMYPQLTLTDISKSGGITLASALTAYLGVNSAFRDYLAHYNGGRGIVFIGHSQGASMLIALLKYEVDPSPATRRLLVSALLLGGNVTVPVGAKVGGDFRNIPVCSSGSQTGCVVAYSSFDGTPPKDSFFGRADSSLNPFAALGGTAPGPMQVVCVNPAAPSGGTAELAPYFPTHGLSTLVSGAIPSTPTETPFVAIPGEYSAHCVNSGGASWLQVDRTTGSTDLRPTVTPASGPRWGLHTVDVNIALGNLVDLVRSEAASYTH
jgi:hypothetical protein